eukprot:TRINITY_DN514_c2_g1_i1.p1 TRINITY_DN514_c2_g1~~TRINITY_DN514_c2_g1_i1.p1  ORF type:complete len:184 (+),score=27.36 TRINITY_DN514_c2_g1_i1:78-629(+)
MAFSLLFLFFLFPIYAFSFPLRFTSYVSRHGGGFDASCGDILSPCATIQHDINNTFSGGSVIVESGVYEGPGNCNIRLFGSSLTIQSRNGGALSTIINCNNHSRALLASTEDNGMVVRIDGFTFINGNALVYDGVDGGDVLSARDGGAMYLLGAHNWTIVNCIFEKNRAVKGGGIDSLIVSDC